MAEVIAFRDADQRHRRGQDPPPRLFGADQSEQARFARAWAAGTLPGGRLLGIVLVDDGPQLAKAQLKAIERIGRMTPHGWRIPWAEGWRLSETSLKGSSPRVRWTINRIRKLAQTPFTEGKK